MDKIRQVKRSFERLLKVWLSKLDFAEEDLVADDLIWFSETFDNFFIGSNLDEFINRDGRYQNRLELEKIDFSQILNSSIEFSNSKEERWSRLKVEKPTQLEYYRQLNEFNSENYKNYNIIDIYFRILKKLYTTASEKELERTKNILLSRVISTVHKVSIFEKKDFDSISLLSDFYYGVLKGLCTKKEILNDLPDEDFLKTVLFVSIFNVYYLPLLGFKKVPLLRQYLLNIWIYLNGMEKENFLEDFLNSLSDMTLSNSGFSEIDLYDIRAMLKEEDWNSDFYTNLDKVKSGGNQVVLLNDLEGFLKFVKSVPKNNTPDYISENIPKYFVKTQEDEAIQLYKFRSMQSLVLEYLSTVRFFRGKDEFFKSFNRLRKNEQWSNHLTFFPKSINDVLIWLILFSELKREMNFRIKSSFGYKFLDEIIIFLFKDIVFDEESMWNNLNLRKLQTNSSFLNSMADVSNDLLNKIAESDFLTDEEKAKSLIFWESMVEFFGRQIGQSESLSPIEPQVFENLISNIITRYKEKSLVYFLSKKLPKFDRKVIYKNTIRTFVIASDLLRRKYVIPDWYSPAYGLSESIGGYLIEEENMQLDYNFFNKNISLQDRELKRVDVQEIIDKQSKDSLVVFRNAYPDFWIKGRKVKADLTSPITFSYKTYDRNSELLIIPKSSMFIRYVYDGRFKDVLFLEKKLMVELLDLGGENKGNLLKVKSIKGFPERFNLKDDELQKYFWIRIAAKAKVVIKDKNSILRFKLNPYGE
ncbi:hypothetical protein KUV23_06140 [Algoriphagus marincola]|uniref:DUF2357 domain-containing protein n=1 Tax=Algoriphagus marincola TaxID=264027 RepID=A0ABS7N2L1_9BACT|nr:hypothetical protein [Algoriphagus marincola]MBY5950544.1 hypothetical protein [Algoriphagus marincola]